MKRGLLTTMAFLAAGLLTVGGLALAGEPEAVLGQETTHEVIAKRENEQHRGRGHDDVKKEKKEKQQKGRHGNDDGVGDDRGRGTDDGVGDDHGRRTDDGVGDDHGRRGRGSDDGPGHDRHGDDDGPDHDSLDDDIA